MNEKITLHYRATLNIRIAEQKGYEDHHDPLVIPGGKPLKST